ncbi:MAG TPA: biotin/lipoyl-containing protein [Ktedonobacterales bacterium]|jgi:biotin carboxyl carrier protein|nr:biotin/lipoyl-containing protein [Ktedonobacterales bacterium]
MGYRVLVGDRQISVNPQANGHERFVTLNGRDLRVDWQPVGDAAGDGQGDRAAHYRARLGGRSYEAYVRRVRDDSTGDEGSAIFEVTIAGRPYLVTVQDERTQALASLAGGGHGSGDATIRAPMPGLVSNLMAGEGDKVERGQALVVLEAMKMENDLTTPRAGMVKRIRVTKGQTVNQGDVLVVVGNPPGEESSAEDDGSG